MSAFTTPHFPRKWVLDTEFRADDGNIPEPVCLVAKDLISGETHSIFGKELQRYGNFPFGNTAEDLFIVFYGSAEWGCFSALGWKHPKHIIDLYVEYSSLTSNKERPFGRGLVGVMQHYGLDFIDNVTKQQMRDLVLRGGPYTDEERTKILEYCTGDVLALEKLWPLMRPKIDIPRAIIRGRFTVAVAMIENAGIPIDVETYHRIVSKADDLEKLLIAEIDKDYKVFEGTTFKHDRFEHFVISNKIAWPRLVSGKLDLTDDTFKKMANTYHCIKPLRQLRQALVQLRSTELPVGKDNRSRCLLSMFSSKTSRNQPLTTGFIFGRPSWMRGLVQPPAGKALAYIDYSQQEFAIAAALSGDMKMIEAYRSGDPYLAFAKQAGAVPEDGTKETHPRERELFKSCVLATQYGMGPDSLALRINDSRVKAHYLLEMHRKTYHKYWAWSDAVIDSIQLTGRIQTVFGWNLHYSSDINSRTVRNFPVQANGAEILRMACILCGERSVKVCAPVHDAILIEAPLRSIEAAVTTAKWCMAEACRIVLNGFEIRTDVKIIRHPDRFLDNRGKDFWGLVLKKLDEIELKAA